MYIHSFSYNIMIAKSRNIVEKSTLKTRSIKMEFIFIIKFLFRLIYAQEK